MQPHPINSGEEVSDGLSCSCATSEYCRHGQRRFWWTTHSGPVLPSGLITYTGWSWYGKFTTTYGRGSADPSAFPFLVSVDFSLILILLATRGNHVQSDHTTVCSSQQLFVNFGGPYYKLGLGIYDVRAPTLGHSPPHSD